MEVGAERVVCRVVQRDKARRVLVGLLRAEVVEALRLEDTPAPTTGWGWG